MELFPIEKCDMEAIYQMNRVDVTQIEEDLEVLKEWIKKEAHLPQSFQSEAFLRNLLCKCKFSVEKTKRKLEAQFVLKNKCKDYFNYFETDFILPSKNMIKLLPLPRLGPQKERIFIGYNDSEGLEEYQFNHWVQAILSICELSMHHDPSSACRIVYSCRKLSFDMVKKMDFNQFYNVFTLMLEGYSCQFISMDLIEITPATKFLLGLLKNILRSKLFERIKIYPDLQSLHDVIGPQYLPAEFGGSQGNMSELFVKADEAMTENKRFLTESGKYVADESRRINVRNGKDENFGMEGTFRKINLD